MGPQNIPLSSHLLYYLENNGLCIIKRLVLRVHMNNLSKVDQIRRDQLLRMTSNNHSYLDFESQ